MKITRGDVKDPIILMIIPIELALVMANPALTTNMAVIVMYLLLF